MLKHVTDLEQGPTSSKQSLLVSWVVQGFSEKLTRGAPLSQHVLAQIFVSPFVCYHLTPMRAGFQMSK